MSFWKEDPVLVNELEQSLRKSIHNLNTAMPSGSEDDFREEQVCESLDLMDTIGRLLFMEQTEVVERVLNEYPKDLTSVVTRALAHLDGSELDDACREILLLAPDIDLSEEDHRRILEESAVEALSVRDRVTMILEGSRFLLKGEPPVPEDFSVSLLSFDEALTHELWRLLPLGSRRTARIAWAAPAQRKRLWWWERGSDLPQDILDQLSTVARLIYLFPETEKEQKRLIKAEELFERELEKPISRQKKKEKVPLRREYTRKH